MNNKNSITKQSAEFLNLSSKYELNIPNLTEPLSINSNSQNIPIVYMMLMRVKYIFGHVPQFRIDDILYNGIDYGVIAYDLDNDDRWGFTFDEEKRFEFSINGNKMNVDQIQLTLYLMSLIKND